MSAAWIVEEQVVVAVGTAVLWAALTERDALARWYFPGIVVESTYSVGSEIRFEFRLEGEVRRDRGTIVACEVGRRLAYDHWSSLSGHEGRTRVTIEVEASAGGTRVAVRQEGFVKEVEFLHARFFWRMALAGLKALFEGG